MARVVAESAVQVARLRNVVEYQDATDDAALVVTDGGRGTFDIQFVAVTANQQGWSHRLDRPIPPHRYRQRVLQRLTGFLVEASKNFVDRATASVVHLPAGQFLGDRIHVLDVAFTVSRNNAVAYRLQRNLSALFFTEQRVFIQLALRDIDLNTE